MSPALSPLSITQNYEPCLFFVLHMCYFPFFSWSWTVVDWFRCLYDLIDKCMHIHQLQYTQMAASVTESVMDPPRVSPRTHIYMSNDRVSRRWGKGKKRRVKATDEERDKNL